MENNQKQSANEKYSAVDKLSGLCPNGLRDGLLIIESEKADIDKDIFVEETEGTTNVYDRTALNSDGVLYCAFDQERKNEPETEEEIRFASITLEKTEEVPPSKFESNLKKNVSNCAQKHLISNGQENVEAERKTFNTIDNQSTLQFSSVLASSLFSKSGLALLASQYDSSETDDENSSSRNDGEYHCAKSAQEVTPIFPNNEAHRSNVIEICSESDSESNSSNSDLEFVSQVEEIQKLLEGDVGEEEDYTCTINKGSMRVKGEILLEDLPPIEDLHITVPKTECTELGRIHSIVDQLVLVNSVPGAAALNLDTVLFLEQGQKVLGEIFDVVGQVYSPLYCVRFNSNQQIKERNIEIDQIVYIAPRTEHTHFVILKDMMQLRGSDASWENDIEPNEKNLDYSDDEEERNARRSMRNRVRYSDEADSSKRDRPLNPSPHQNSSASSCHQQRHQYQRPLQYRDLANEYTYRSFPHPHYSPSQRSASVFSVPFSYGDSNATWHAHYNETATLYMNPYSNSYFQQQMPFTAPGNAEQETFPPPY